VEYITGPEWLLGAEWELTYFPWMMELNSNASITVYSGIGQQVVSFRPQTQKALTQSPR